MCRVSHLEWRWPLSSLGLSLEVVVVSLHQGWGCEKLILTLRSHVVKLFSSKAANLVSFQPSFAIRMPFHLQGTHYIPIWTSTNYIFPVPLLANLINYPQVGVFQQKLLLVSSLLL